MRSSLLVCLEVAAVLLLCIIAVDAHQQYLGVTTAPLVGDTSVTLTSCNAVVAYKMRLHQAQHGSKPTIIPYLDLKSAFVQMHPATWAVNVPIMSYLGFQHAITAPELFGVKDQASWAFVRNASNFSVSLANFVAAPTTNSWQPRLVSHDSRRDRVHTCGFAAPRALLFSSTKSSRH